MYALRGTSECPLGVTLNLSFLFVNTEESYGARTTDFGVGTSPIISQYLRDATELVVVPQESRARPGFPDLDVYNRMLGLVFVDGELLQTRIVSEGWSAYYTAFGCAPEPIHSALLYAETLARRNAAGIWAVGHPTGYEEVLGEWIGGSSCRPNPYQSATCR